MKTLKEFIETMAVGLVLIFVLIPIRILFVRYIADDWFGSFGIITAFFILILVLSMKNKLGWFGRAFVRQMFKVHKGKRRIFVYSQLILGVMFFSGTVYAIEIGDSIYEAEKEKLLEVLDIENIDQFMERSNEEVKWGDLPMAFLVTFYIIIFRFDLFAVIISSLNEITDGWVLHFSTVFLVEEIELIGILILTKFVIKKPQT